MSTQSPFTADRNKFAYAQAFSRTTTRSVTQTGHSTPVRSLAARLQRTAKTAR